MVENPQKMISKFCVKEQSIISFHLESTNAFYETIHLIYKHGYIASIAIKVMMNIITASTQNATNKLSFALIVLMFIITPAVKPASS